MTELVDLLAEDGAVDDLDLYDRESDLGEEGWDDPPDLDEGGGPPRSELLAFDAVSELERRAVEVGDNYPILVDQSGVLLAERSPVYEFLCALMARRLLGSRDGIHKGARLFELLTAVAMRRYIAGEARAIGFPRCDGSGFRECVQSLVRDMRDQLSVPVNDIPGAIKDLGVDVVAWRPLDSSPGNVAVVVQCATGRDWLGKGVQTGPWQKIVKHAVPPVIAIAFPFVPEFDPGSIDWELMCGAGGVPLHRLRLATLVDAGDVPNQVLAQMESWVAAVKDLIFSPDPVGEIDSSEMLAADEADAMEFDCELPELTLTR